MNKRNFLKSLVALPLVTFIGGTAKAKTTDPKYDRMKLSHQYPGAYHCPNDLWTPEEIIEAGFVFVPFPTFIHRFDDPWHPILQSYIGYGNDLNPKDTNLKPMICKTSRFCGANYTKTYDLI